MAISFPASWKNPESPGYGTYPGPYNYQRLERYLDAVTKALELGYRHIDTAQAYRNEAFVGEAIRRSLVPREDIFLTSKLSPSRNSFQGALDGLAESIQALKFKPDLYLIHYPGNGSAIDAWRGLLEAKAQGLCAHVGVSNFEKHNLSILLDKTGQAPAANQIEFHPHLWSQSLSELLEYCGKHAIAVEGYSPFAEGKSGLLRDRVILEIAKRHQCPASRVVLKWSMQHGVRPIAGSLSPSHLAENAGPYGFTLSPEDMSGIDALGKSQHRVSLRWGWDPRTAVLR